MRTRTLSLSQLFVFLLFFVTGLQNAQARGSFFLSVDSVNWKEPHQELTLKGKGEPGSTVYLYASGTDYLLTSVKTDNSGRWSETISNPNVVPCVVRAESDGSYAEKEVSSPPLNCLAADSPSSSTDTTVSDVTAVNNPPEISGTPSASGAEGSRYYFAPSASDPDGDSLTFSIVNRPAWASFDGTTGVLSGTPGSTDAGSYDNIQISVSDGSASASLSPFSIGIANTNQAPSITGTPAAGIEEGRSYSFTPSATDPDGDSLRFSIVNRPAWASFNTTTGTLSGTPGNDAAGVYGNIQISVSDGSASASLTAFSITVSNTNQPPSIGGAPASSVEEGSSYSFSPTASDPDGDSLSFSIANLPVWATFDATNGTLSGTPGAADVGVYENIVITVSDGTSTASLTAFSVSVSELTPTTTGRATLSWVAPVARSDGSPLALSEIAGYKVYMGTTPNSLARIVDLKDGSLGEYVVDKLSTGTYYFSVTAYDSNGRESTLSELVTYSAM